MYSSRRHTITCIKYNILVVISYSTALHYNLQFFRKTCSCVYFYYEQPRWSIYSPYTYTQVYKYNINDPCYRDIPQHSIQNMYSTAHYISSCLPSGIHRTHSTRRPYFIRGVRMALYSYISINFLLKSLRIMTFTNRLFDTLPWRRLR